MIKKRSIRICGHETSVSIEAAFWNELREIASEKKISLQELIEQIDKARTNSLSGALRLFVLKHLKEKT
ncbi:MAG: ribbon-helix-helix domain-containing protein [Alphaproteobacteria bacterium]|nr:ribbon-helix-helix domain-containing protein [Alphaproteobacteria bacterium]MCL2505596.1 ribbon-helix-helix domain-containing protein [Alphaproteobacteria bacterium]